MIFKSNQKQIAENRKDKAEQNYQRERESYPGPYLAGPVDSPAHWPGASRPLPLPVGRGGRQRTRAPWRHATSLPACVPRHRDASGFLLGAASNPWTPSLVPFVSPSPSPSCTPERLRRRRSQPPQPQPLPRPLSAYPSSALTPWSYPPTHAIRGSRNRPEHHRLHLRCPEIDSTDSARPELPRLRRLLR